MTSTESPAVGRVAVIGTGLLGTSIAMAAARVGCSVTGWDVAGSVVQAAAARSGLAAASDLAACVADADLVVVCTPIASIADGVARALEATTDAVVTDVGSIKAHVLDAVGSSVPADRLARFVGGHPMGGSERSGPEHASASLIDGIVWVVTPAAASDPASIDRLEAWIRRLGAVPVRMDAHRHDRLVAFVSHLPQVASTALMGLAATEEANEPEILLLAAGGFRDLTRLAASNPALWSEILVANREAISEAIDLFSSRLRELRDLVRDGREEQVRASFAAAKAARLTLAAKPHVHAGVVVLRIEIPDEPGSLAELTASLAGADVNIEDLQIVHSPEGGRGAVHLTVAGSSEARATEVLASRGFELARLA